MLIKKYFGFKFFFKAYTFVKKAKAKLSAPPDTPTMKLVSILNDFSNEIKNFKQICPIEMLDKLENPISLKKNILQTG